MTARHITTAAILFAALLVAGGWRFADLTRSQVAVRIVGEVRLDDYQTSAFDAEPKPCVGREALQVGGPPGPQEDIFGGAQVVVRDEAGVVIGKTGLGTGAKVGESPLQHCALPFAVEDLPERPFYQVEVGRQPARVLSLGEVEQAGDYLVIAFP